MLLEKMYFEELCPYVRNAGIEVFNNNKTIVRRIYDHEFILGVKGSTKLIIEDRIHNIEKNKLILIKPNLPHTFNLQSTEAGVFYWIHLDFKHYYDASSIDYKNNEFHESLFKSSLQWNSLIRKDPIFENEFRFPEYIHLNDSTIIKDIFTKVIDSFKKQEMFWQLECRHFMLQFLNVYLKNYFKEQTYYENINKTSISHFMKDYVNKNIRNRLTLKTMSVILGYNAEYLGKIFIKETGEPFSDFVNKTRLNKAFQLIKTSSLTISNISELCGFSDTFYFSKVMKKYTGKSPREVKKRFEEHKL